MGKAAARPKGPGGGGGGSGNPGKIFVGGLARDTSEAMFVTHFGQYGDIVDSVIIKDKFTSQPRGFGFITYSDPAVVDKVIEDNHIINGKQVEIKRTIPKGSVQSSSRDSKTKKIFVGGLPTTLTEDEFKSFFARYGAVVDHQIMRDHETKRSRGFGFIVFASEQIVDDLLANGNMIDLAGSKVEIKKAEPKKSSSLAQSDYSRNTRPAYDSDPPRDYPSADTYSGLPSVYSNYNIGESDPYRIDGGVGGRLGIPGRMGGFGSGYGRYYAGLESYGGGPSIGYPSRLGMYGGGFDNPSRLGMYGGGFDNPSRLGMYGGGFDRAYAGGGLSGFMSGGAEESFGAAGTSGFGGPYNSALADYGSTSTLDRSRGSFTSASGRYNPYGR